MRTSDVCVRETFVPPRLPGESLYSLLARTAIAMPLDAPNASRVLLGHPFGAGRHALPYGLSHFERFCAANGRPTTMGLQEVRAGTVMGGVLPFLSACERARSVASLLQSQSHDVIRAKVGVRRGAESIGHALRRCPDCAADDLRRLGFTYWRTVHQLAGMCVCPWHGRPLQWLCLQSSKRRSWEVAHRSEDDFDDLSVDAKVLEALNLVAVSVSWCSSHERLGAASLAIMLRSRLRSQGLIRRETTVTAAEAELVHRRVAGVLHDAHIPHFRGFEGPGWIRPALTGGEFAQPLRWALLVASTLPSGYRLAGSSEAAASTPSDGRHVFGLQPPSDLDEELRQAQERCPQMDLLEVHGGARIQRAPQPLYAALAQGLGLAQAARCAGLNHVEAVSWVRKDPVLAQHWHRSIAEDRLRKAREQLSLYMKGHPETLRSKVLQDNLRAVRALARYSPHELCELVPPVQPKYKRQLLLTLSPPDASVAFGSNL